MSDVDDDSPVSGMKLVELWVWFCERCDHLWLPRNQEQKPKVCPKCKSPYWDTPRRNGR